MLPEVLLHFRPGAVGDIGPKLGTEVHPTPPAELVRRGPQGIYLGTRDVATPPEPSSALQVQFDETETDHIVSMKSDLGELIPFEKHVVCTGGVEIWLNTLLNTVRDTVKNVIAAMAQALQEPDYDFIKNFVNFCGQVRRSVPPVAEVVVSRCVTAGGVAGHPTALDVRGGICSATLQGGQDHHEVHQPKVPGLAEQFDRSNLQGPHENGEDPVRDHGHHTRTPEVTALPIHVANPLNFTSQLP